MDPVHSPTANEEFSIHEIHLRPQVSGFGFRFIGGKEEETQVWNKLLHTY